MTSNIPVLMVSLGVELVIFGAVFVTAWAFSRANRDDLFLWWKGKLRPLLLGIAYSVGLRLLIFALLIGVAVAALPFGISESELRHLQPETKQLIDIQALKTKPAYLWINLTFVSFVVAGLREELWRAGMLAGFAALFPAWFSTSAGRWSAIILTAIIFGLGHLPQGFGGVLLTGVLGIGLGWIMLRYSTAEATLAHGFFDATTFLLLFAAAKYAPQFMDRV